MDKRKMKKLLILNLPYFLVGLFATNLGEAWRLAEGADSSAKILSFFHALPIALNNPFPSFHPLDLLIGILCGAGLRLAVYLKGKNAKKYRHNVEYGSARWGTAKDIEPFIAPKFEDNVILTKTERLMMSNRPKNPANARNKNVLIIGGSGSGKTRFWLKPNLLQMHSSYGVNTWAMSTYESRKSLIANYIRPLIGDMKLEDVTPRIMDKYYRDLLSVKAVSSKYVKARTEYLTPHTVREVHKTLRNAFNQAVKWELMTRNPVEHATLPKEEHKTRDIWTAEVLQKALEACDDDILRLAINLAFSCSLRMGELLGLTWDCIDISPTSIELGQASIFVEKELQRVNREAMADLDGKDIMFKFPPTFASTHTALVLKTPKTKTSVRKVFLPKTVAEMLVQRKADIEELKDLFGDEFVDFNLVFCSSNGKPIEGQVINRAFNKLIEEKGLPKVVFHSLRHSSITYKLKLNGGDMKSVQGDSGHAQVKMVADVYSHIIDDDRRLNAERMEAAFYSGRQATPEPVQPAATESSADDKELLLKLLQNPEMAALLKSLAKTL